MAIPKPILGDNEVWASNAPNESILIPYEKINSGWSYANKPSYQYFNWFWNTITGFFAHLNQNGIPVWDIDSYYDSGAFVKHNNLIYRSIDTSMGVIPRVNSRNWRCIEFLNALHDVYIDLDDVNDILVRRDGVFENKKVYEVYDRELGDLKNVTATDVYDTVLVCNTTNLNDPDAFTNKSAYDVFKNNVQINSIGNVEITNPVPSEILQYKSFDVQDEDGNIYKEYKWINTYNNGIVNYNTLINTPSEFQPYMADDKVVGGCKMWLDIDSSTGSVISFNINTVNLDRLPAPNNLTASTDGTNVNLRWTGTSLATGYDIYVDDVKVDTTGTGQAYYTYVPGDNLYHIYYVKAVNSSKESYKSNQIVISAKWNI